MAASARSCGPLSPKVEPWESDETVALQVQQFLDEWYYCMIDSALHAVWSRQRSLSAALDNLEHFGLAYGPLPKEELMNMDEPKMVDAIVEMMPMEMRQYFELIAQELIKVARSGANFRSALDSENKQTIQEACMTEDGCGVCTKVLQLGLQHAGNEVGRVRHVHATWRESTERRLERLQNAAECAEHAHQQLLSVEAQLAAFGSAQSQKARSVLMGMASGQDEAIVHTAFSGWMGVLMQQRAEGEIRNKYESEINELEQQLLHFKQAQVEGVTGMIMRQAGDSNMTLLSMAMHEWSKMYHERKNEGDTIAKMKEMQDKIAAGQAAQAANAKQVLVRMSAGSQDGLLAMVMQAWVQFSEEYKQNKEIEDAVRAAEAKLKQHMEAKKEETKRVLDRMVGSSNTGLLSSVVTAWVRHIADEKKAQEMYAKVQEAEGRFASMNSRQKGSANGVQGRINNLMSSNLLTRCLLSWSLASSTARLTNNYTTKIEGKRRQLSGVQNLFQTFAKQLEDGLGNAEELSSRNTTAREPAHKEKNSGSRRSKHHNKESSRMAGSVSLPNIHQRPVVA